MMPTSDITITYEGNNLVGMSDSGTKTLKTAGKYLTDDITISYVKGSSYTRTEVVSQQTLTPNSSRSAAFNSSSVFIDGEYYIITLDGTEYVATARTLWGNNIVLGDAQVIWGASDVTYPFAAITMSDGSEREFYFTDTNQHTIKIERLEFT